MQNIDEMRDEEIVRLLRNGSHPVFEQIYHRYKGVLLGHAYKKLGVFEEAKEIVQAVFTKIWINHRSIPEVNNLAGWLFISVRNQILKHISHQQVVSKFEKSFSDFVRHESVIADHFIREKEMKLMIDREIEALPPKMKHVFLLSRNERLPNKAIAEQLNISENTVKNHLKAALKILRQRLGSVLFLIG